MIGIINYGSGNIQAIANIYNRLSIPFTIISNTSDLSAVDKLVLPGVGAFDSAMTVLNESGLRDALDKEVLINKKPVIGVCVGMQILSETSEEGKLKGLGWIKGRVKKFDKSRLQDKPYLPHMGWNNVKSTFRHRLFDNLDESLGFYFVHSYYFEPTNPSDILGTTIYGETFASAVYNSQIFGVQFHPEKSHSNGIQLLSNFATL